MKAILSEKNLVVVLFILVLITFSFAQEDSKKIQQIYTSGISNTAVSSLNSAPQPDLKAASDKKKETQANFIK
ncbi:MAG TPA: hypothetical protein VET23_07220 [Chitinophagaceae bacterium]|nr:hypothetical protein [Chitinophagaceae bacterium]